MSARRARKAVSNARALGVRAPEPLLPSDTERRLTSRQRELLDELERLLTTSALSELTMAQIAARTNCSLRTLYGISPSKDELVLILVDRALRRIGRAAIKPLEESMSPLEKLRAYLHAANRALQPTTASFGQEFAKTPGARRLIDAHENYVIAVARSLLEGAVAEEEIGPVDCAAVAHVLGGLGREFTRPEVADRIAAQPEHAANAVAEIILRGLVQH